jgi:hypothetical protein
VNCLFWLKRITITLKAIAITNRSLLAAPDPVLEWLEGIKAQLASPSAELRIAALSEALKYGQERLDVVIQSLKNESGEADWEAWCRYGETIGWYVKGSWLWWNDLTFTLNAPVEHLPRGGAFMGWGLGDFWTGCKMLSCLRLKLTN